MKVKIRNIEDGNATLMANIGNEDDLNALIRFIERSGGVIGGHGDALPFHSYQLVLDEDEFYVEILLGEDE